MSHIHNIAFSSESHPVWIRREICTGENSSKQICCWILMCKTTLFTGGSIIMDYGVVFWPEANKFKVKCLNVGFVSYKHSFLVNWSHVDYCDVFNQLFELPFWWHSFTTEHPLVSKLCNANFLQICSDEETSSSTSWMAWGWDNFQQIVLNYLAYGH